MVCVYIVCSKESPSSRHAQSGLKRLRCQADSVLVVKVSAQLIPFSSCFCEVPKEKIDD